MTNKERRLQIRKVLNTFILKRRKKVVFTSVYIQSWHGSEPKFGNGWKDIPSIVNTSVLVKR